MAEPTSGRLLAGRYNSVMFSVRAWNIAMRTAHIGAMGVLLGGYAFDVDQSRLLLSLWLTIATGVGLAALEAGPSLVWFHQVRGLLTLAKLGLLGAMRLCLEYRLAILLLVVVIASVGSHMPARFRYYSVIYRRVLRCRSGPGASWLTGEGEEDE